MSSSAALKTKCPTNCHLSTLNPQHARQNFLENSFYRFWSKKLTWLNTFRINENPLNCYATQQWVWKGSRKNSMKNKEMGWRGREAADRITPTTKAPARKSQTPNQICFYCMFPWNNLYMFLQPNENVYFQTHPHALTYPQCHISRWNASHTRAQHTCSLREVNGWWQHLYILLRLPLHLITAYTRIYSFTHVHLQSRPTAHKRLCVDATVSPVVGQPSHVRVYE